MTSFSIQWREIDFKKSVIWTVAIAACVLPWFILYCHQSVNFNEAWLAGCASRLMEGQNQTLACYDTNPPLSIIAEVLPAVLNKFLGVPIIAALPAYNLFLAALSTFGVIMILKSWPVIPQDDKRVLIFSYIIAITVLTGKFFGERDHIVVLGLFPFLLLQVALTLKWPLPSRPVSLTILILGAACILIKPHYGIIPALIITDRCIRERRLSVFKDADFIALALGVIIYAAVIFVFFRPFLTDILPSSLILYVEQGVISIWVPALELLASIAVIVTFLILLKTYPPILGRLCMGASLISLIPFIVQNKGFGYHLVPALVFFLTGATLSLLAGLKKAITINHAVPIVCVFAVLLAYIVQPPDFAAPSNSTYKNYSLTKLASRGGEGCSFFMLDSMRETQSIAAYSKCQWASRFPVLWPLPALLNERYDLDHGKPARLSIQQLDMYDQKYAAMLTDDFLRYKPDTVILAKLNIVTDSDKPFDLLQYLAHHDPRFSALWKNYRFDELLVLDRPDFFRDTKYEMANNKATYLVYDRIPSLQK